jgi:putative tryptophan/tyrosine transport system substrate-binding protein
MRVRLILLFLVLITQPAMAAEKVWRVGLLSNGPPPTEFGGVTNWRDEILEILAQNGFSMGRNLEMVERYSGGQYERLPILAQEIGNVRVDVVVAITDSSVRAVLAATRTTPVVMVAGYDPVAAGFVSSLAHPGGRITGIVLRAVEGDAKRLQLLREALPSARRFAYLVPSQSPSAGLITRAAAQLNVEVTSHLVDGPAEYGAAFDAMRKEGVAGVVIAATQATASYAPQLAASAARNGLPTICEWDYMARAGCVFGYGHDLIYAQRRVGEYVARILKGAVPAELPVEQSDAWKLTINLKAAAQLGLAVPLSLLARANEVIE